MFVKNKNDDGNLVLIILVFKESVSFKFELAVLLISKVGILSSI